DGNFDYELALRHFGEIFREFHLDVEALSVEEAGKRIGASSVALELASHMDEWATLRRLDRLKGAPGPGWQRLLAIARTADPDDWRNQVRDAMARGDREALESLASSDRVLELPPWTLSALGWFRRRAGTAQSAEALLRTA